MKPKKIKFGIDGIGWLELFCVEIKIEIIYYKRRNQAGPRNKLLEDKNGENKQTCNKLYIYIYGFTTLFYEIKHEHEKILCFIIYILYFIFIKNFSIKIFYVL